MRRIHEKAAHKDIPLLTSDVSRTAQPFFMRFGFTMVEEKQPIIRGIVVSNASMEKRL
jgi:putative acetyltransferase